jgi:hypothetical protein
MTLKTVPVATFIITLAWLTPTQFARAQQQAPIGHRQPTAADVPSNDSVQGDANLSGQTPDRTPKKRGSLTRGAQNNLDVILETPNIYYNCNN